MHLRKQVEAGVLIYALLMAAIFVLLLQFYLERLVANQRQNQALESNAQAYLMAQMIAKEASDSSGQYSFNQGKAIYQQGDQFLRVTVELSDGGRYTYDFPRKSSDDSNTSNEDKSKPSSLEEKGKSSDSSHSSSSTDGKQSVAR
ncbi:competence type IV pilus minor pilin ComGG [Streptococcus dentasini]